MKKLLATTVLLGCLSCSKPTPVSSNPAMFRYIMHDGMCFLIYKEAQFDQGYMGMAQVPCEKMKEASGPGLNR